MALVFVVVLIIYFFVKSSENMKEFSTMEPIKQKGSLKTNARLEKELINKHFKELYDANGTSGWKDYEEAYEALKESHPKAQKEITELGFIPCIPLDECRIRCDTIYIPNVDKFDSEYVKVRRERLVADNGQCTDEELYADFKDGSLSIDRYYFDNEEKRRTIQYSIHFKPGDLVTCVFGLCRVKEIQHNWDGTKAFYLLETLDKDAIFKTVRLPVTDRICSTNQMIDD